MTIHDFELLARSRRAVRHFKPDPIDRELLERCLDCARWAPSGYNLQPTHMTVIAEAAQRKQLRHACMDQAQITEAPATIVFSGDRRAPTHNFEAVLERDRAAGAISADYETKLRRFVPLAFARGPLGLGWLWKALLPPWLRMVTPLPTFPAVEPRYWLAKQASLAAMNFMLAARSAGLATVPMEGFDEQRVARIAGLPDWHVVILVVPVGHAADQHLTKTRLPLESMVHWGRFGNSVGT